MIYFANCKACGAAWRVIAPVGTPMDLNDAIGVMEAGLCPTCGNNGAKGPVNWRFTFGGDKEPTYGQIRHKQQPAPK